MFYKALASRMWSDGDFRFLDIEDTLVPSPQPGSGEPVDGFNCIKT